MASTSTLGLGHLHQLQQTLPATFLGQHERNPLYIGTIALGTAMTVANVLVDTKVVLAHAGGNRFGIETAVADQERFAKHAKLSRRNLDEGRYYTVLMSVFNHSTMLRLAGHAWVLWHVGRKLRPGPFVVLFYGGGILGNLACLALDQWPRKLDWLDSRREVGTMGFYHGAGGGLTALVAFTACLFPSAKATISLPFSVTLPSWTHTVAFAAYCGWMELSDVTEDIAYLGHLSGVVWGLAYYVAKFQRLPWL